MARRNSHAQVAHGFSTRNDLAPEVRNEMIELLNQQLADTFDLYSQTKQAHWNVKGAQFYALHLLFDELAGKLEAFSDQLAERATALGGMAMGTARMAADRSRLPEFPTSTLTSLDAVEMLGIRYAHLAATTRTAIARAAQRDDQGTVDLLSEIVRELDKTLWFLEAHLQA